MIRPLDPGARLLAAASLVRAGRRAADIGCDHGKLAVHLIESGRCPYVVAADLRSGPLGRARAMVEERGLSDRIDCRLGDGLSVLAPQEAEDIVIAGMGGETIAEILAAAPWVRAPQYNLVLLSASSQPELRRWLCENGFALCCEIPVAEGRHCYTVMQATYTGRRFAPDDAFCLLGLLRGQRSPAAKAWFVLLAKRLRIQLEGRRSAGEENLTELTSLLWQVEKELSECPE